MIINVYKEKNWTSFDVVAKVRGYLRAITSDKKIKVGHAGTLDPLAEGVLLVLTGEDTKNQDRFMEFEKEYDAVIGFGVASPTYDLEGPLKITKPVKDIDLKNTLEEKLTKYLGEFEQKVPPYSAVKVSGKPLYKSARKGDLSENMLPVKKVKIYDIKILDYGVRENIAGVSIPTVRILVRCAKGTYIRSLAHDLGEDLGVGAILLDLIRTGVGDYRIENSIKISELPNKLKM